MSEFPKANALLSGLNKDAIVEWLNTYPIGRTAMGQLEKKLAKGKTKNECYRILATYKKPHAHRNIPA